MQVISELKIGESATITGYQACDKHYRHKLLSMGLTPGQTIQLIRVAPLGDPIQVQLRGYVLSLRKAEANVLKLTKVVS